MTIINIHVHSPISSMMATCSRFWSPKKRAIAMTLCHEGYTFEDIAIRIGGRATKSGVYKLCTKFEKHGQVIDRKRLGQKKKTSEHDDRMMIRAVMKDRRKASKDIAADLNESGVPISLRTVRRRLCQVGLKAKTPRKKPFLNHTQKQRRVVWAREHISWTLDQ